MFIPKVFYQLKPFIPRYLQILLRRNLVQKKRFLYSHSWPVDAKAGRTPEGWPGWPDRKQFALVLTHDVETAKGQEKCRDLIRIEEALGFRSSFNFIPERYEVSKVLRDYLTKNDFEVGVHGLNHDGKLYKSKDIFKKRAMRINQYLKEWKASGFRSPSMHHNLEWIHNLNIDYDASTFDSDPFEPQSEGVRTIFPFWVSCNGNHHGYVELPYTLPQDFTLFVLMKEKNINIWKKKLDWIAEKSGMALIVTHPDYMNFNGNNLGLEEYPAGYYEEFLDYVERKYKGQYWHMLPKQMAAFLLNQNAL